jgi:hypothetical protein
MDTVPENVVNKTLYKKVKKEAKEKFDRYPSLYASSWITREYKKRNGKYSISKKKNDNKNKISGQKLWYKEKWIQIIPYVKDNKIVDCGDTKKNTKACRPLVRVNDRTPPTMKEIIDKYGKEKVLKLSKKKNRDMEGRLNWTNGTFTSSVKRSKVKPDKK